MQCNIIKLNNSKLDELVFKLKGSCVVTEKSGVRRIAKALKQH